MKEASERVRNEKMVVIVTEAMLVDVFWFININNIIIHIEPDHTLIDDTTLLPPTNNIEKKISYSRSSDIVYILLHNINIGKQFRV